MGSRWRFKVRSDVSMLTITLDTLDCPQYSYSIYFAMRDKGEGPEETHEGSKWRDLYLNGPILAVLDSIHSPLPLLQYQAH